MRIEDLGLDEAIRIRMASLSGNAELARQHELLGILG
jgi:hypothetical protein